MYLKFFKRKDKWLYGTCNGKFARKHLRKGNVQFIIWKKGDQKNVDGIGHLEDVWIDFDQTWWQYFKPDEK